MSTAAVIAASWLMIIGCMFDTFTCFASPIKVAVTMTTTTTTTAATTTTTDDKPSTMSPRYAEIVMQAQCQAQCLSNTGELAYSSDVTLLPAYSCTTDRCRQCSAPCDTDIINLVSPSTCKSSKCSPFDKLCHESCNLRFRLKQANMETGLLPRAPNPFDLQIDAPEMLCIDDSASQNRNGDDYDLMQPFPPMMRQQQQQATAGGGKFKTGRSLTLRWMARFENNKTDDNNESPKRGSNKYPVVVSVVTMRRNNSHKLTVIGKIVGQVITVTYLSPRTSYIFDVTSVTPDGIIQPAVSSEPIYIAPMSDSLLNEMQPPVNGKIITKFFYASSSTAGDKKAGIAVYVNWKPDPMTSSCYYDVFILKYSNGHAGSPGEVSTGPSSSNYQHVRARTKETHNVLRVDSLDFDANYTVRVFTADRLYRRQSGQSLDLTLETPSCLEATKRNYTLCGPEPPINATGEFFCHVTNKTDGRTNLTTIVSKLSLVVNWSMPDMGDTAASSFGFEIDVANDPVPELIGAIEMPSDWKTLYVRQQNYVTIVDIIPNQIYFVQIRTVYAGKKSRVLLMRLASPGSRSSLCSSDSAFVGLSSSSAGASALDKSLDYIDEATMLIANWTNIHARHRAQKGSSNSSIFTELAIALSALCAIAIVIIGFASFWLRRSRLVKQAKHVVETVPMKCSTLYEMTSLQNQKFDRFEVNWTQLTLLPHILGEGAFGKVIHGQLLAPELTGSEAATDVAVKMLRDNASEEERLNLLSEIETMKRVRQVCGEHPNVVSLLACVTRNGICTQPALVMDLCPFGSLRDYLRQLRGKSPREIASLCGGKATALFKMPHNYPAMRLTASQPTTGDSGVQFATTSGDTQQLISTAERLLLLSLETKQLLPTGGDFNNGVASQYATLQSNKTKSGSVSTTCTMDVGPDQNPPLFMLLLSFAAQIAAGMEHLAVHKFVHRDLATRNVLVYDFDQVKISDFGLSRDIYDDAKYQKTTAGRLPIKWMAPEAIIDQLYTTASDVWSFGIVLWELVTLGATPYCLVLNQDLPRLLRGGHRLERPDNCPEDLYGVMTSCWSLQTNQRPTFTQLLEQVESLQSKAERNLATSVYELEDYVTMKTRRLSSLNGDAVLQQQQKKAANLMGKNADCLIDEGDAYDDDDDDDDCCNKNKYNVRAHQVAQCNNYTKLQRNSTSSDDAFAPDNSCSDTSPSSEEEVTLINASPAIV